MCGCIPKLGVVCLPCRAIDARDYLTEQNIDPRADEQERRYQDEHWQDRDDWRDT